MKEIWVLNGPNLNLLGLREPAIYGRENYEALCRKIRAHAEKRGVRVSVFQSNHEGALVDEIQRAYGRADGLILNPGAYTHTSVALLDALLAVGIPAVEVHISDLSKREAFRQQSFVRAACVLTVTGEGTDGYLHAMDYLLDRVLQEREKADGNGEKSGNGEPAADRETPGACDKKAGACDEKGATDDARREEKQA
ncbi:MAG: type II 3-dehydroquinate dehydratase [Eubacteriales bacterium]|nr:type II 3-dehydroquinate dehydratase [Eubacteriales bacterium]